MIKSVNKKYSLVEKFDIFEEETLADRSDVELFNSNTFFEKIDHPYKSEMLGWLASDGGVDKNSNQVYINLKDDEDNNILLEKWMSIIGGRIHHYPDRSYRQVRWVLFSAKMKQDLIKLGVIPCKSGEDLSSVSSFVPDELMHYYVRGFSGGDGHASADDPEKDDSPRSPKFGITAKRKETLESLRDIICFHTGVTVVSVIPNKLSYLLSWSGVKNIIAIRDWLYQGDSFLALGRKKDKMFLVSETYYKPAKKSDYTGIEWDRNSRGWSFRPYYNLDNKRHRCGGAYKSDRLAALIRELGLFDGFFRGGRNFKQRSYEDIGKEVEEVYGIKYEDKKVEFEKFVNKL